MTTRLTRRLSVGILVPAFNLSLEPELNAMRPDGVTNHAARIDLSDGPLTTEAEQADLVARVGPGVPAALKQILAIRPDVVLHGISIPTFWDGLEAARKMEADLEAVAGVPVVIGSRACETALEALGRTGRLGIITPYQPNGDAAVDRYFRALGRDVALVHSLRRPGHRAIAEATTEEVIDAFKTVKAGGADIILQIGTNLAAADLAGEAERWLGVPVVSINAALYWCGLRRCGITDPIRGFGRLFEMT